MLMTGLVGAALVEVFVGRPDFFVGSADAGLMVFVGAGFWGVACFLVACFFAVCFLTGFFWVMMCLFLLSVG